MKSTTGLLRFIKNFGLLNFVVYLAGLILGVAIVVRFILFISILLWHFYIYFGFKPKVFD